MVEQIKYASDYRLCIISSGTVGDTEFVVCTVGKFFGIMNPVVMR